MLNYSPPHIPDSPSSSIHTNMIAPGILEVKIIGRLDSMSTGNVWRKTNLELDRTSPKRVIVDASGIEYCDGSGIGCFDGRLEPGP
ncbi:MAG: STAS domain-containing protein [Desulfobacterales bacterium]